MGVFFLGALIVCYIFTAVYPILRRRKRILFLFTLSDVDSGSILSFNFVFKNSRLDSEKGCWEERVIRKHTENRSVFRELSWIWRKKYFQSIYFPWINNYRAVYWEVFVVTVVFCIAFCTEILTSFKSKIKLVKEKKIRTGCLKINLWLSSISYLSVFQKMYI